LQFKTDIINGNLVIIAILLLASIQSGWSFKNSDPLSFISITLVVEPFLDCEGTPIIARIGNLEEFTSYYWLLPDGSEVHNTDLTITETGDYIVFATGVDGSDNELPFTIGQHMTLPDFDFMVVDSVTCNNDVVAITFDPTNLNYFIDGVAVDDNLDATISGGIHTIRAEGGGCFAEEIVNVPYDTLIPFVEIMIGDITCENPEAQLSASENPEIISFNWYNTLGQLFISAPDAEIGEVGNYFMIAVADNGCTQTFEFEVIENKVYPEIQANSENLSCENLQAALSVSSNLDEQDVSWVLGGIAFDTLANILVDEAGNYKVIVTDPVNGCMTDTVMTVSSTIDFPSPAIDTTSFQCGDSSATLIVTSNEAFLTYEWYDEQNTFMDNGKELIIDNPGTYILETTNSNNGCIHFDTLQVLDFRDNPDEFGFSYQVGCGEEDVRVIIENIVGGVAPYEIYLDSNPINSGDTLQLLSGDHIVTIADSAGCSHDTTFNVQIRPVLEISTIQDTTIDWPDSLDLDVAYNRDLSEIISFDWQSTASLSCIDCEETTIRPSVNTAINITVEDIYGCIEQRTIQVDVDKSVEVYIPNAFSPNNDGNNDFFTAFASSKKVSLIRQMTIYDRWGNPVYDVSNIPINEESVGWNGRQNFKVLEAGVYVYQIVIVDIDGVTKEFSGQVTMMDKQN